MGSLFVALMGPRSSMGSPVTFMMRPRVPGPTGTKMGYPVSFAVAPRTRPSVPASVFSIYQHGSFEGRTVHSNRPHNIFSQMLLYILVRSMSSLRFLTNCIPRPPGQACCLDYQFPEHSEWPGEYLWGI